MTVKVIQHGKAVVFPFQNDSMKMSPAARQIYYMMWFNVIFRMPGAEQREPHAPHCEHCSSVASQVSNVVSTLLSELTKSERKSAALFSMESRDIFHNSRVTLLIRQEILPKVCSAAWIRLMKHESELVHAHTDREGEGQTELVLPRH